jgi:tRNA (mo5U34)-methyltransferase
MLGAGARCVVGVDPTLVYVMQWLAQAHFACAGGEIARNFLLPLRDRDLPQGLSGFDTVFSMGVIYHRRDPAEHLARLRKWLRSGGRLVLETLVIDGPGDSVLVPEKRYARMRNVHYLPTPARLEADLRAAGFTDLVCVDRSPTTPEEQRTTPWMRFESLARCLDPDNPSLTVEGYPAPVRAMMLARSP